MTKEYPIQASNVVMQDTLTEIKLRGVLIRPEIISVGDKNGSISSFNEGNFLVVTSGETEAGERMDAFVNQETFSRILAGEEVTLKSRLQEGIDLELFFEMLRGL